MSKYSDGMEKDVNAIKKATKDLIDKGSKLAFEKYHEETSLERIKKKIREGN